MYVAALKQAKVSSAFNGGQGQQPYVHHYGDEFTSLRDTGIFIWDQDEKKVHQLELPSDILPSYASFANQ